MSDLDRAKEVLDRCLEEIKYFLRLVFSNPFDSNKGDYYELQDFLEAISYLDIMIMKCDSVFIVEEGEVRGVDLHDPVPPKDLGYYIIDDQGNYIRINSFNLNGTEYYDPLFVVNQTRRLRYRLVERLCLLVEESNREEQDELAPLFAKKLEIGIWRKLATHQALDHLEFIQEISQTRLNTDEIERELNTVICSSDEDFAREQNLRLLEYHNIAMAYITNERDCLEEQRLIAFAQAVARLMVPQAEVPWKVLFREHLAFLMCLQKIGASFIEIAEILADNRSPIFREISKAEEMQLLVELIYLGKPPHHQVSMPSFFDVAHN